MVGLFCIAYLKYYFNLHNVKTTAMADEKKVVLQDTSNSNKHHDFTPEHAERLLAYPGSKWQKPQAEVKPAAEAKQPKATN